MANNWSPPMWEQCSTHPARPESAVLAKNRAAAAVSPKIFSAAEQHCVEDKCDSGYSEFLEVLIRRWCIHTEKGKQMLLLTSFV